MFVFITLGVNVEGFWLNAAVRGIEPIILSFGAAFVALSDVKIDNFLFCWNDKEFKEWFKKKYNKYPEEVK